MASEAAHQTSQASPGANVRQSTLSESTQDNQRKMSTVRKLVAIFTKHFKQKKSIFFCGSYTVRLKKKGKKRKSVCVGEEINASRIKIRKNVI